MAKKIKKKGKAMSSKKSAKKGRSYGGKPVKFRAKVFDKAKNEVFGIGNQATPNS